VRLAGRFHRAAAVKRVPSIRHPRCLIFESMSERREGVRSHLESPDQGSGDYSNAPSRATSRREIRDALLHPVPTVFDSAVTRYLRPCSGPSTTAFCDRHSVCACIYVQLIPMLFRATLARRVRRDLSASILTACCHNESRGRVRGRGRDGVDSGLLPPVLFSFNAAKSGRCLQRKIKVPRFLAVCLSAGFLFLALLAFSFFLLPSSASFPSSLSSSTCIRIHYKSIL